MNENGTVFDEDEAAEFISNRLLERGIIVKTDDIKLILELEFEYIDSIGLVGERMEEEQ